MFFQAISLLQVLSCQAFCMISVLLDYLANFYQTGNLAQVEVIARTMLAAVPDDVVALQFLGLALYQMGRVDDAQRTFKKVSATLGRQQEWQGNADCEPAHAAIYRQATRAHSGLADGWYRIALVLNKFGFHSPATRAFKAALSSRGVTAAPSTAQLPSLPR